MPFTGALYYPSIRIENEGWLINALLYWDTIHTIVPEAMENPYITEITNELHERDILLPLHVQSDDRQVRELSNVVSSYLNSPEGLELLIIDDNTTTHHLHRDKLSQGLVDILEDNFPAETIHRRVARGLSGEDWVEVPDKFAKFYMTLLAAKLSDHNGIGMITESASSEKLATAARLDAYLGGHMQSMFVQPFFNRYPQEPFHREMRRDYHNIPELAEGTLVDLIFKDLQVDPLTPLDRILEFRETHADELGRFRRNIGQLTRGISDSESITAMNQQIIDIYKNNILPAVRLLKRGLRRLRVRRSVENFIKLSIMSTTASGLLTLLGFSSPYVFLAAPVVSIIGAGILYNVDKEEILDNNPYSYLLSIERNIERG